MRCFAKKCQVVLVFGIVLVQHATRGKSIVNTITQHVSQFVFSHTAMEGKRRDDMDVVNTSFCSKVENRFNDALTNVGACHFGKWQRNVVEGNGEFHAREQERWQWVHLDGVQQCMTNCSIDVVDGCFWLWSVNDSRAIGRQLLEGVVFTAPKKNGWGRAVYI